MEHVAFIRPEPLSQIVSGTKRYEVRLSKRRTCIWQCCKGDRVFIKESGGPIKYASTASEVVKLKDLTPIDINVLRECVGANSSFASRYFSRHKAANYAILIEFCALRPVRIPEEYTPTGVQMGWVAGFKHGDRCQYLSRNTGHLPDA